jgi:hypothetical protein
MVRYIIAAVAAFITWVVLDFVIHGVILASAYEATMELWRPMEEMKMWLMYVSAAVMAVTFTALYGFLAKTKTPLSGLIFGILYGIASGFPAGFGSYSFMPIPLEMAVVWFVGMTVEAALAGLLIGIILSGGGAKTEHA